MLVKNTIIALMAVAPALSIPVPATVKSASTVATTKPTVSTKATVAPPTAQKVTKAAVTKAEGSLARDAATDKSLRAQLKAADSRLLTDATSARKLEKAEFAQDKAGKATRTAASKIRVAPGSKLSTKLGKTNTSNKSVTAAQRLAMKQSSHQTTSHVKNTGHSKTNALTGEGRRNRNSLRIDTGRTHKHIGLTTPGSSQRTGHSVVTPGSAPRTGRLTGQSVNTPGSGFPSAFGTGQSQYGFYGPQTGFQSPPMSGRFRGMSEDISYTPETGGGYKESISWQQPGSAKRLARRALTPTTSTTPTTPTTPVSLSPSPLAAFIQKQRSRKSAKVHQHTIGEAMQLSALLSQAEKVVNGLEEQLNKPHTVFHNLKRKSALKHLTVPRTPVTPSTPATPSAVRST